MPHRRVGSRIPYPASQTTTSADSPDHRLYTVTTALTNPSTGTTQITVTVALSTGGNNLATETSYFSTNGTSGTGLADPTQELEPSQRHPRETTLLAGRRQLGEQQPLDRAPEQIRACDPPTR